MLFSAELRELFPLADFEASLRDIGLGGPCTATWKDGGRGGDAFGISLREGLLYIKDNQ